MNDKDKMVQCLVICRNADGGGLGVHSFARVPCKGEWLSLPFEDTETPSPNEMYEVEEVVHCSEGEHVAELHVTKKKHNFHT